MPHRLITTLLFAVMGCSGSTSPGATPDEAQAESTPLDAASPGGQADPGGQAGPGDETVGIAEAGAPADASARPVDSSEAPYPVGTRLTQVRHGTRVLPLQLWYPAGSTGEGQPSANFEPPGPRRDQLGDLFDEAPAGCVRTGMDAVQDAAPLQGPALPIVLFSHCHSCLRFSAFGIAEHLAAHGFVVAAPDHVDNTLFDELDGNPGPLSGEFLRTRADDIGAVLDALLEGSAGAPVGLQLDGERIGMFGHSYGAVTTGLVLQEDSRVKSGVAIAAPIENPLIPGVSVASQTRPLLYLVATEDNSITELGNFTLRGNYDSHPAPAWKVEVTDAGHWSFSEICGLIDLFQAGCGEATRQTNPLARVTYIDNAMARAIARDYVLAFFQHTLLGDPTAKAFLSEPSSNPSVQVDHHP